jgi:hypothetical protein
MSAKAMYANGTIRVSRFVKVDTTRNNAVVEGTANAAIRGISQEGGRVAPIPSVTTDPVQAAIAGENINVYTSGEDCLLRIGSGGCTAGDYLESDADGDGVTVAATAASVRNVGAQALETAVEGELCKVEVLIFTKTNPA